MIFLKSMTESFNKSVIKEDNNEYISEDFLDFKIKENYLKLQSIKKQYDDTLSSWKNLCEDASCFSFGKYLTEGNLKEQFQNVLKDLKMDFYDTKKTLDYYKELKNKPLLEADFTLSNDLLMDPSQPIKFREIIKQNAEKEAELKAQAEREAAMQEITSKALEILEEIKNSHEPFETAFNLLVPKQGNASTLAGELLRAIMKILYRDYNDGDVFYQGYGLETCGPAAAFLMDNGYWDDFEDIVYKELTEDSYTSAIEDIKDKIVESILNPETGMELLTTENTKDMYDFDTSWLEENQPRYEFEIYVSDDINSHMEAGNCDAWKLKEYVEEVLSWESYLRDAEVATPWSNHSTELTITNLTKDGLDRMEDMFNRRTVNIFWSDLVNELNDEYGDPNSDEDEESDED